MKCPSCADGQLQNAYLDELFPCKTCDHCGGNWLLLEDYLRWRDAAKGETSVELGDDINVELTETKKALICPVSGALMLKYRVSKDTTHRLDLSTAVNGIWLDKGEWQLLKKAGLAHKLNSIFTDPWQRKIRTAAAADTFEQFYIKKFGEADYAKIKEMRDWIHKHPKSDEIQAFLVAVDPWSAIK